jgi:hypothetical protein
MGMNIKSTKLLHPDFFKMDSIQVLDLPEMTD